MNKVPRTLFSPRISGIIMAIVLCAEFSRGMGSFV